MSLNKTDISIPEKNIEKYYAIVWLFSSKVWGSWWIYLYPFKACIGYKLLWGRNLPIKIKSLIQVIKLKN